MVLGARLRSYMIHLWRYIVQFQSELLFTCSRDAYRPTFGGIFLLRGSDVQCTYSRFSQLAAVAIVIIVYYASSIAGEAILNS